MGPLRVIPGSHKDLHVVRFHRESGSVRLAGPKRIELADVDVAELESKAIDIFPMQPGDVILLHGWTLHRSGMNTSPRARWVFNPRFSDLLDERVVANDWRVSRAGEPWVFAEYHPELVKE
jgi:ectoine hydroxylase-related dioxygenase (phytanoyl-CoA dioxygenase family)